MVTVNVAHTAPVNPASTTSKLSISQLWVALERKARKAEDFVDAIAKTELLEEPRESFVKRKVVFRPHPGMPDSVVEDVTLYKPSRVRLLNRLSQKTGIATDGNVLDRLNFDRTQERWSTMFCPMGLMEGYS